MFQQSRHHTAVCLAILAALLAYAILGGYFAREIVVEIAILAILAISLDIVAGYGGMVSLFHGAIMGVAAYGYGALTVKFEMHPVPAAILGVALAATFGTLVGAIVANTAGIFYIMATLAFGQMAYTMVFQSRWLGGDDGLAGLPRFDFEAIGIDMNDPLVFSLFAILLVILVYLAAAGLLRSAFGRTLCGIHSNEARMRALGVTTWIPKMRALGTSSLLAGIAGILAAQHTQYISPELLHWTVSGEVLIVVILGGLGTLTGALVGAVAFVALKHGVGGYTDHWHIVVGVVLIAVVLAGGRGLFGQFHHLLDRQRNRAARAEAASVESHPHA